MQSRRKVILASLMLFLVFWNGLLGNVAVATLCLHSGGELHFEHGSCGDVHHAEPEAEEHGCCDHEEEENSALLNLGDCYDIELKGVDDSYRSGARSVSMPQSVCTDLASFGVDQFITFSETLLRKEAAPRAPPELARLSERIVARTVLRI